jgi:hypothetical protein
MIDTIKFLVPIDNIEYLKEITSIFDRFKKDNLKSGLIEFEFYTFNIPAGSYNRTVQIRQSLKPSGLFIEFSIPKYEKGNNIEMIYPHRLKLILEKLHNEISQKLNNKIIPFSQWPIYRLDICYNWLFANKEHAQYAMNFIQKIDYPRKQKYTYQTSVMFKGSSYTIKFYLKGAEFLKHDFKSIETETALKLFDYATRMLRFEVSMRKEHLLKKFDVKSLFLVDISDDEKILKLLQQYLESVFKYVTPKTTKEFEIETVLYSNFTKTKATRLYQFYKGFFHDEAMKKRLQSGGMHRATIYRYKKELKVLNIGSDISDSESEGIVEQLIIPSPDTKFDLLCREIICIL